MSEISPFYLDLSTEEKIKLKSIFGEILDSGQLILGKYTDKFESEFANYVETKYAVSLNSGTSALEALLIYYNVKGKKIAVPTNTNFASVVTIIRNGGTPIFLDMDPEYFLPTLENLKYLYKKYQIDGVMWVHIGGIISPEFCEIVKFCRDNSILLIEDCAHAHGSTLRGKKAGSFGDGGAFSFFPTKVMTTIEGGMITTNNEKLANIAKSLRNQGKRDGNFGGLHYDMGSSWRISEIAAAMGIVQLNKLDEMIGRRALGVNILSKVLDNLSVSYCSTSHMDTASHYKFICKLESEKEVINLKKIGKKEGIVFGGGVYDIPCHNHPVFSDIKYLDEEVKNSEEWCKRQACPPITSGTTIDSAKKIESFFRNYYNGK
ncbi:DegT/DnrJ/EryC1/StrS family aminotransferase [Pelagibacterales bacterium]|nr:DegT/DnrJ/EryC1/StrS family aminotransferase [Pelagibacterales bacterium]